MDDNMVMISLSALGDESLAPPGKRLLAARVKVRPDADRLDERSAERFSERIVAGLRDLIPFLDDFTDFVAVKESFEMYNSERNDAWMQSIDDERLCVALMNYRTPQKNIYYTGRAVLPGLGMEGEAIAARTAANILSEKLAKK